MTNKEILKRLEEIEARAEKATPEPWTYGESEREQWVEADDGLIVYLERYSKPDPTVHEQAKYDFDFIAHSREDVPWLCKTVRQLVARLEEVEAQCAAMREALEEISRTEPDEKPDGTILGYLVHNAYEMSEIADAALRHEAGRDLLDRLRKLERVAETARELIADLSSMPSRPRDWSVSWARLRQALAALEEAKEK